MDELHRQRCAEENDALKNGQSVEIHGYDDHVVHIEEHTAFLLTEKLTPEQEKRVCEHLNGHKIKTSEVNNEG